VASGELPELAAFLGGPGYEVLVLAVGAIATSFAPNI
jgi:hypothetical protein